VQTQLELELELELEEVEHEHEGEVGFEVEEVAAELILAGGR